MNLALKIGNLLSFFIGCLGVLLTYQGVEVGTDFPLFMDVQNILILVPCFSLMIGAVLFIMYDNINSKGTFAVAILITMSLAGSSFYILFKNVYSYIGLSILYFELFLVVTLYFYICLFNKYLINKAFINKDSKAKGSMGRNE
ncbi:hypothetical protein IHV10_11125 [Fictibacillus sp. 5RED26]|uniref:hypothetical protein n=1 Tax=Fictibacillus sp. 5RED26 TaxID=2745876 RepID=UPI0018CECE09|nr:hypothetical protein [Fictibacillus sp. 5RED26]MBH0156920.1 hypothetical protein [Fictibacillus sp. 5RED26]